MNRLALSRACAMAADRLIVKTIPATLHHSLAGK